ncbi:MAG: hypothetical protein WCO04_02760 [Pseudomonadota bacterium]
MLYDGYSSIGLSTTLLVAAVAPLVLATLGFSLLPEGLRNAHDPRRGSTCLAPTAVCATKWRHEPAGCARLGLIRSKSSTMST